jgi:MoxR-like ATPase
VFLDEVGKAGPAVLNPMLTALNEGLFHNNSKPIECKMLTAVGASNEELEEELAAMWDRWMMRMVVKSIQEPSNFAALLLSGAPRVQNPTTVDLAELMHAREVEVPAVTVPPGVVDSLQKLKAQLKAEEIRPSDRRWRKSMDVLRASAWLNGRSVVDEDDLAILQYVLWDVVEQISKVTKIVLQFTSELTAKAVEFARMLDEIESEITSRKGQSVESRARFGGEAQAKVGDLSAKAEKLREQANREGRSTAKLDEVIDRTRAIKQRIFVECLNVDPSRAARMSSV